MGYALSLDMLPRYTYDDYCHWTDRWELIDGVPYAMSPLPTVRHQRISMKLAALLDRELGSCQHCHASLPIDWKITEDTVVQPDVLVACFPIIDSKFIGGGDDTAAKAASGELKQLLSAAGVAVA